MEIFKAEEIFELGSRVVSALVTTKARPSGNGGDIYMRYAAVATRADVLGAGVRNYPDIDEDRAAAERLAESRE
jgi:hypothetical protein